MVNCLASDLRKSQSQCVWSTWQCAAWMHESFLCLGHHEFRKTVSSFRVVLHTIWELFDVRSRLADGTECAYDFGWHDFHASGHGHFDGAQPRCFCRFKGFVWAHSSRVQVLAFFHCPTPDGASTAEHATTEPSRRIRSICCAASLGVSTWSPLRLRRGLTPLSWHRLKSKDIIPGCQDVVDAVPEDLAEDDEKELSVVHPARPWRTCCGSWGSEWFRLSCSL